MIKNEAPARFRAMLSCGRIKITTRVLPWLILPSASNTLAMMGRGRVLPVEGRFRSLHLLTGPPNGGREAQAPRSDARQVSRRSCMPSCRARPLAVGPKWGDQRRWRRATNEGYGPGSGGQRLLAGALRFDALGSEVEAAARVEGESITAETKLGGVGTTDH